MFWIELFTADKEYMGIVPAPYRLSDYEMLIELVKHDLENEALDDMSDDVERERDEQILAAKFIACAQRFHAGDLTPQTMEELTQCTLASVLGHPKVWPQFRELARNHMIQVALPRTPAAEIEVLWVKPSEERTLAVIQEFGEDARLQELYLSQCEEIIERNEALLAKSAH